MADIIGSVPFGIDALAVEARDPGTGALSGTKIDVFAPTGFSVTTESDSQEARGGNRLVRLRRSNKKASGSVSMLNHQPAVLAAIGDGVSTTSGVTPNTITTYSEPDTAAGGQYAIYAQAADGAGATRVTVLNASTSSGPTIDWSNETFAEPGWDFEGLGDPDDGFLWLVETYETEAAIA